MEHSLRRRLYLFITFIVFFGYCDSSAVQDIYIPSEDFSINNKLLQLNMPYDAQVFKVEWEYQNGRKAHQPLISRKGVNLYDLRNSSDWSGKVKIIRIPGFQNTAIKIKEASFMDEIKLFLGHEHLLPTTVGFLYGHKLFGISWNSYLLAFMLLVMCIFWIARKSRQSLIVALFVGFIAAWIVMDVRNAYDHLLLAKSIDNNFQVIKVKQAKDKMNLLKEKIGSKTWSFQNLSTWEQLIAYYELADYKFVPEKADSLPDIMLTKDNK